MAILRFRTIKLIIAALVALALFAPAGATFAAEETGTGTLTAKGVGLVRLEGSGTLTINRGAGNVWVTGDATIQTSGKGRKTILADGTIRLTGYSGIITITGEDLVIRVEGGAIDLSATGKGNVLLKGKGSYSTASSSGTWTKVGITIGF
jgi:hypothetical protein